MKVFQVFAVLLLAVSLSGCDAVSKYLEEKASLDRDKFEYKKTHEASKANRYSIYAGGKWFAPLILDKETGAVYRIYRNMENNEVTDEGIQPMPYKYGELVAFTPEDFWTEVNEAKRLNNLAKKIKDNADKIEKTK